MRTTRTAFPLPIDVLLAGTLAAAAAAQDPAQPRPDPVRLPRGVAVEREVALQGGTSARLELLPAAGGQLFLWVGAAIDTRLEVEQHDGRTIEDDASGGGRTPWLALPVVAERRLRVTVHAVAPASGTPDGSVLHAFLAPTTEARCRQAAAEIAALNVLGAGGASPTETRQALCGWIDRIAAVAVGAEAAADCLDLALADAAHRALQLGALDAAQRGAEAALRLLALTRAPAHRDVLAAQRTIVVSLLQRGDLAAAGERLRADLASAESWLPPDSLELQRIRLDMASLKSEQDDVRGAIELEERVVAAYAGQLPPEDPRLVAARINLALDLKEVGELERARALQADVLVIQQRVHGDDHVDVASAQLNLGITLTALGFADLARELKENALATYTRWLPDHHPSLLAALQSAANARRAAGDPFGARGMLERVVDAMVGSIGESHPRTLLAMEALALATRETGEAERARDLLERVLAARMSTLEPDHPTIQGVRHNLGSTLLTLGEFQRAAELTAAELSMRRRTSAGDIASIMRAEINLACAYKGLGRLEEAAALERGLLQRLSVTPDDKLRLDLRNNRTTTLMRLGDRTAAVAMAAQLAADLQQVIEANRDRSPLLVESNSRRLRHCLSTIVTLVATLDDAQRDGDLVWQAFVTAEALRAAVIAGARVRGEATPHIARLEREARRASVALAALARSGADSARILDARLDLERIERRLHAARNDAAPRRNGAFGDVRALARELLVDTAWIGFLQYDHTELGTGAAADRSRSRFVAFVLHRECGLRFVPIGDGDEVSCAVGDWRTTLCGARGADVPRGRPAEGGSASADVAAGKALAALVLAPLLPWLDGVRVLEIAPDDVLHLVPFDALPLDDRLVGDRFVVRTRNTLAELHPQSGRSGGDRLVLFGGVDYDAGVAPAAATGTKPRSGGGMRFDPLPATGDEVEQIAAQWRRTRSTDAAVYTGAAASRAALLGVCADARVLHLATHGWFSPPAPEDPPAAASTRRNVSAAEQITAGAPMLLCGLALAGANRASAEDWLRGVVTGEELARLDLSGCDLAVLSACDTHAGVRRSGQGVASLQKALHLAGAASVVTSLWQVPDESTKVLMVEFYRRLWSDGEPKDRALWGAKQALRNARDEQGRPRHALRDWAGWVLTGDTSRQ